MYHASEKYQLNINWLAHRVVKSRSTVERLKVFSLRSIQGTKWIQIYLALTSASGFAVCVLWSHEISNDDLSFKYLKRQEWCFKTVRLQLHLSTGDIGVLYFERAAVGHNFAATATSDSNTKHVPLTCIHSPNALVRALPVGTLLYYSCFVIVFICLI